MPGVSLLCYDAGLQCAPCPLLCGCLPECASLLTRGVPCRLARTHSSAKGLTPASMRQLGLTCRPVRQPRQRRTLAQVGLHHPDCSQGLCHCRASTQVGCCQWQGWHIKLIALPMMSLTNASTHHIRHSPTDATHMKMVLQGTFLHTMLDQVHFMICNL